MGRGRGRPSCVPRRSTCAPFSPAWTTLETCSSRSWATGSGCLNLKICAAKVIGLSRSGLLNRWNNHTIPSETLGRSLATTERENHPLPALPTPRSLSRGGRARQTPRLPGPGILGPAGAGLWRPRRRGSWSLALRRARMARTAPGGCLPATVPGSFYTLRSIGQVSPISPPQFPQTTAWNCATCTLPRPAAAPLRITSPRRRKRLTACPTCLRRSHCWRGSRWWWRWAKSASIRCCAPTGWRAQGKRGAFSGAFAHAAGYRLGDGLPWLVSSYHPSQQNTQTGRLTPEMFDLVWRRVRELLHDD